MRGQYAKEAHKPEVYLVQGLAFGVYLEGYGDLVSAFR